MQDIETFSTLCAIGKLFYGILCKKFENFRSFAPSAYRIKILSVVSVKKQGRNWHIFVSEGGENWNIWLNFLFLDSSFINPLTATCFLITVSPIFIMSISLNRSCTPQFSSVSSCDAAIILNSFALEGEDAFLFICFSTTWSWRKRM